MVIIYLVVNATLSVLDLDVRLAVIVDDRVVAVCGGL
jgi:hypothetical protein